MEKRHFELYSWNVKNYLVWRTCHRILCGELLNFYLSRMHLTAVYRVGYFTKLLDANNFTSKFKSECYRYLERIY